MTRKIDSFGQTGNGQVTLRIETEKYKHLIIGYRAEGAAGSALVLSTPPFEDTNFPGAPAAPGANAAVFTSLGDSCAVNIPTPSITVIGLTVAGGVAHVVAFGVMYMDMKYDDLDALIGNIYRETCRSADELNAIKSILAMRNRT